MLNEILMYPSYEIIGGEKIMAPSARPYHSRIIMILAVAIYNYTAKYDCGEVFTDNVDVHLPDGNIFKPDLVVMTAKNAGIIDWNKAIYGVPDMVVEILSRSTMKNDLTIKKDTYEANGVNEYWIVDPFMEVVDVYLLRDGKYFLDNKYINFTAEELEELPENEKAAAKSEITLATFPDLTIKLSDIFYNRHWR